MSEIIQAVIWVKKYVIILILVPVVITILIFFTPLLFIVGGGITYMIITYTPNHVFEEDFAKIPEVALFIEKYPNHSTSHGGEFAGWKAIQYGSEPHDDRSFYLYVKKSVLTHKIVVYAGCNMSGLESGISGFSYDIPREQIPDYIKNDECLRRG